MKIKELIEALKVYNQEMEVKLSIPFDESLSFEVVEKVIVHRNLNGSFVFLEVPELKDYIIEQVDK